MVAPLATVPRGPHSLTAMLTRGRTLAAGLYAARHTAARLPDVARGAARLLGAYRDSPLAAFHEEFYRAAPATRDLDLLAVPPCMRATLTWPNDLLLKPEHLQHLVRGLMARGWTPAEIAGLVREQVQRGSCVGRPVVADAIRARGRNSRCVCSRE